MTRSTRRLALPLVFVALAAIGFGPSALRAATTVAPPTSVGFSAQGLSAYGQALKDLVDEGRLAGVATLVARHGTVVMFDTFGYQDLDAKKPLARDTIFRLASMTKPIVGVAMMILHEEGRWTLDDPVAKHIPEFKDLKVAGLNGPVPQAHPMTMRELMSHTAGFDVNDAYNKIGLPDRGKTLQAMIDRLAQLPLPVQPGTGWRYGPSVNIQGYVVEKLSKQPLDVFLRTRIFEPLKMHDTGFSVEKSKLGRVTRMHTYGPDKRIMTAPTAAYARSRDEADPSVKPVFLSGSGGLLSTVEDYWRFTHMILNGGELEGARIIAPATVELMRTNVLAENVKVTLRGPNEEGIGFGLDFAIVMDPAKASTPRGRNSFYWGGAFGTWFWIDPTNDLIVIGMIQNVGGSLPNGGTPPMRSISSKLVYEALSDPKK